jgi:hypothetical protein
MEARCILLLAALAAVGLQAGCGGGSKDGCNSTKFSAGAMEAMGPTHGVLARLSWTAIFDRHMAGGEGDRAQRAVVVGEAENGTLARQPAMQ